MTGATELSDEERETAYLLGEALIPEHDRGPSADEAGMASTFLDQALALRPDLATDFRARLAEARGADPRAFCEKLRVSDPAAFERLTFVLTGAYLLSPVARRWLGYEGQQGEHQDGSPQPEYGPHGLLDAVRARGPIYRQTP